MKNFGPYVNETIDFRELNEQRLFLLEGKTGCSKSTIIDGVVFALYGQDTKGRDEGVREIQHQMERMLKLPLSSKLTVRCIESTVVRR